MAVPPRQSDELKLALQMLGLKQTQEKYRDVVFVCVDCEAHEFQQAKITEVGVAVLDMRGFEGTLDASTVNAEAFTSKILYAHYRITEYAKLVNKRYVKGCPENFSFGQTVWVKRADARLVLERVFRDPNSLATAHIGRGGGEGEVEARKIVTVGHDLSGDVGYLKHLDFDMGRLKNVVGKIDTQRMASAKKAPIGLSRLLKILDVEARYLHNAGNDAAFTMQALVLMAVKEFHQPGIVDVAVGRQQTPAPAKTKAKGAKGAKGSGEDQGSSSRQEKKQRKRLEQLYKEGGEKAVEKAVGDSGGGP